MALNLQSTQPEQYARKHRYTERTGMVSQTKSDSVELAQIDAIDERFHEDCVCAQASQSALRSEIHKLIVVDQITPPTQAINQRIVKPPR